MIRCAARACAGWLAAALGYALIACAVKWPLPLHLKTQLLGDPGGDTGVYVWNFWIFRHELIRHAHLPFSTDHIFAFTGGSDFSLHNFAPVAGALGVMLIGPLGVVGAFNLAHLVLVALSGLATLLLARRIGLSPGAAWSAGAIFIASPTLVARDAGHYSLTITGALPLFLWALLRTLETRRLRDALLVGISAALATYSDAYFGIFCLLMGVFVVSWHFLALASKPPAARGRTTAITMRLLDGVIVVLALLIAWRWGAGPLNTAAGPIRIRVNTLYTPMLLLAVSVCVRAWMAFRPVVRLRQQHASWRRLFGLGLASTLTCLLLLLPAIVGIAARYAAGRMPDTPTSWRSSPRGVDLFAYVVPNQNHPWFGERTRFWLMPPGIESFPEYVASFSIVGLVVIAAGLWLRVLPRLWVAFAGVFALLSLGPFVHVAGANTYLMGPWALLRYMPVVEMARTPSRFAIVAVLGLSLLFAFAVQALLRHAGRWRQAAAVTVAAALVFELAAAPRHLYSAAVPDVYRMIAAAGDETGRLLELPTGIRDGTSSVGNFNPATQYFQTAHRRPVIGGYLSRVGNWRRRRKRRSPVMRALLTLSEGRPITEHDRERAKASRDTFLRASCVSYVLVHKRWAPDGLEAFAADTLRLRQVYADEGYALYQPVDQPPCGRPTRPVRR